MQLFGFTATVLVWCLLVRLVGCQLGVCSKRRSLQWSFAEVRFSDHRCWVAILYATVDGNLFFADDLSDQRFWAAWNAAIFVYAVLRDHCNGPLQRSLSGHLGQLLGSLQWSFAMDFLIIISGLPSGDILWWSLKKEKVFSQDEQNGRKSFKTRNLKM